MLTRNKLILAVCPNASWRAGDMGCLQGRLGVGGQSRAAVEGAFRSQLSIPAHESDSEGFSPTKFQQRASSLRKTESIRERCWVTALGTRTPREHTGCGIVTSSKISGSQICVLLLILEMDPWSCACQASTWPLDNSLCLTTPPLGHFCLMMSR